MTLRSYLAGKLDPEMHRKAHEFDVVMSEISYQARWLSEFKFVSRTLDRLYSMTLDRWRPIGTAGKCKEASDISSYREDLRRSALLEGDRTNGL